MIGDGRLNYHRERILETYYAFGFNKWSTLSVDNQYIFNPGYNSDRGPVFIYSTRFHTEL